MPRALPVRLALPLLLALSGAAMASEDSADDAAARELLLDMAQRLSSADAFTVSIEVAYDAVQASGQQIEFRERRELAIDRPNRFRIATLQSDGDGGGLVFDGTRLSRYNLAENVYTDIERSGDIDDTLRYIVADLGARVPLARLFVSSLPEDLDRLSFRVDFVEYDQLGDPPTVHLAAQGETADYQFWISDDGILRRIVITYVGVPGEPQFRADFRDWDFSPNLSAAAFEFQPMDGAERIMTVLPILDSEADAATTEEPEDD